MPYGYASPVGAALSSIGDSLMDMMMYRDQQKRQKLLDEVMQRDRESLAQSRQLQNEVAQANLDALNENRATSRAQTIAGVLAPNQSLDDATVTTLREGGMGSLIVPGQPRYAGMAGDDASEPVMEPSSDTFRGTADQVKEQQDRARLESYVKGLDPDSSEARALNFQLHTGHNPPAGMFDRSQTSRTADIQNYEYEMEQRRGAQQPTISFEEWRKQKAEQGVEGRPYFTTQPVYDSQGRPVGGIRTDHRTGQVSMIDMSALGGGQLKPPPGQLGSQSILNEASLDQLDRLKTMFDNGASDLIGPIEGRARSIGQQVPGVPVNDTFAEFEAASMAFQNAVIKAITGAQMSEPEATRIKQQIPLPKDKPEVWRQKYAQTVKNLEDLENRLKTDRSTTTSSAQPAAAPNTNDLRKKYNY